ncbi:hypothetical protein PanWU01x14_258200 [Parasponia andersonii]|uniref:Uncharacterized protein n=1 Tax=Parasponia andersonii TaxID=3476 RepID=A0A2P5B9J1_PARAD|nr:hypothetical protein PanWU01x14_258200 [Parasponia andersonii]
MGPPQSLRKIDEEFSLQLQSDPRRFKDSKGKLTLNPLGGGVFFLAEPDALRSNQPYGLLEFEVRRRYQIVGARQLARGRNLPTHHSNPVSFVPAKSIQGGDVELAPQMLGDDPGDIIT